MKHWLLAQLALTRFEIRACTAILLLFVGAGFIPWPLRDPSSYGFPFSFFKTTPVFQFKINYFLGNASTAAVLCILFVAASRALIRMRFRLHLGTLIILVALSSTLIFANLSGGERKIGKPSENPSGEVYYHVRYSSGGWPLTLFEGRFGAMRDEVNSINSMSGVRPRDVDWGLFYGIINFVYCAFLLFGVMGLMELYVYRKRNPDPPPAARPNSTI